MCGLCHRSLPLRGRWPSGARSDEVAAQTARGMKHRFDRDARLRMRGAEGKRPLAYRGNYLPAWEGGRAERGRMRSPQRRSMRPAGMAAVVGVARRCRFQRGRPSAPARKLSWPKEGRWAAAQTCAGANAAPAPAQGVSPLDPFSLARSLELRVHAVSIAAAGHPLGNSVGQWGTLGCRPDPRKGFHPLTRFRFAVTRCSS